jgi:hypothetical protein
MIRRSFLLPNEFCEPFEDLIVPLQRVLRIQYPVILIWEVEETAGDSSSTAMGEIRFKQRDKVKLYVLLQGMEGAYSVSFG